MKNKAIIPKLLIIFLSLGLMSCNNFQWSLFSPSGINKGGDLAPWRPCVIVQNPGSRGMRPLEAQFEAIDKLQRAGRLSWVRLGGLSIRGDGQDYLQEAKTRGLKVFAIVNLDDLNSRLSWEDAFDEVYSLYPGVDIWEIAGEISNPFINNPTMTPEEFMPKFKELVSYIKTNYPGIQIASPPTLGSVGGPLEFQKFVELGLLDMDVIITVNVYTSDALRQYSSIFDRHSSRLNNHRIWVTETGSSNPDNHIDWVNNFYPNLINTLRPEMICWYALWTGDVGGDNPFGLITGVESGEFEERQLFKELTEEAQ